MCLVLLAFGGLSLGLPWLAEELSPDVHQRLLKVNIEGRGIAPIFFEQLIKTLTLWTSCGLLS